MAVRLSDYPRHGTVPAEDQNASAAVPHRRRPISAAIHAATVEIYATNDQIRPPVAHGSAVSLRAPSTLHQRPQVLPLPLTAPLPPPHPSTAPLPPPCPKAPRIHRTPALAPWFHALDPPPPPPLPITAPSAPAVHLHRAPVSGVGSETPTAVVRSESETPTASLSPSASPSPSAPGTPTAAVASPAPVAGPRLATGFTEKSPLHLAASPTARPQEPRVGV
eukprot:XP_020404590.1 leucine-rich repeat extensin-like protein 5 [Zea mays]